MRIGNLEDLDKSAKSENWNPPPETAPQGRYKKWKNWWYYYKWYVVCGMILLGIAGNIAGSALGLWQKTPDFQIAYIGKAELPQDTISALEQAFQSIASDFNGDGTITVQINQYIDGITNPDGDTAYYEYASEIALIGDISDCDSYFFLMDDPNQFQREFQLLASPDGSCPDSADYSVDDKVIAWQDCPVFSRMELGSYSAIVAGETRSGQNQELLSGLFLGRRCFFTGDTAKYADKCSELWDYIHRF